MRDPLHRITRYLRSKDFAKDLLFVAGLLVCHSSVLATYWVPSGSMRPVIQVGDRFVANKLAYRLKLPFGQRTLLTFASPKRGDVIVFRGKGGTKDDMTKRVVGLPGDRIEVRNKRVHLNGRLLPLRHVERRGEASLFEEDLAGCRHPVRHLARRSLLDDTRPIVVPEGHLFVMGDNRDDSADSRLWGFVPLDDVEGKLVLRYWASSPDSWLPDWNRLGRLSDS